MDHILICRASKSGKRDGASWVTMAHEPDGWRETSRATSSLAPVIADAVKLLRPPAMDRFGPPNADLTFSERNVDEVMRDGLAIEPSEFATKPVKAVALALLPESRVDPEMWVRAFRDAGGRVFSAGNAPDAKLKVQMCRSASKNYPPSA